MRRAVQIVYTHEDSMGPATLVALCEDGTIWCCKYGKWKQLPEIPGPKEKTVGQILKEALQDGKDK